MSKNVLIIYVTLPLLNTSKSPPKAAIIGYDQGYVIQYLVLATNIAGNAEQVPIPKGSAI